MRDKRNYLLTAAAVLFIIIVMFALNHGMPLHRDDYDYSMIWKTGVHLASLPDVFESAYRHYLLHGGRMFTVTCLNFFLWAGKVWFDIANTLFFVILIFLICFHARREIRIADEPVTVAVAGLLAWFSFPHFGEVAVWKSGSTVYLWSAVPVALFLLPYNLYMAGRFDKKSAWLTFPMFVLGIIAGWSVENLAVTVVLLTGALSYYCFRQKRLAAWMVSGASGALIGLAGLLAAPGNYVRYGQQGAKKGFLIHIGNQFAGNGEMLLYLLPVILLLFCAWQVLKASIAEERGIKIPVSHTPVRWNRWVLSIFIILLVFSYFHGSFVAGAIRDFLVAVVLTPLHLVSAHVIEQFDNVMAGLEEIAIYWLLVFFLYSLVKERLGITKEFRNNLSQAVSKEKVLQAFPQLRYAAFLFVLALFNNFVMIGAPTFPARATFSSVVMILIGTVMVLRLPVVSAAFSGKNVCAVLLAGALALGGFTVISALRITYTLRQENDIRVAMVKETGERGEKIVEMPPIRLKNRALRHVFFKDFDNVVTKEGLCEFYGIRDIKVTEGALLK